MRCALLAGFASEPVPRSQVANLDPFMLSMRKTSYDATIVGAGPNGLTAAAVLAAAGLSVVVLERNTRIGGGCSTEAVTLPGFAHDVCSAIHPMGRISLVFRRLQLEAHGLEWVAPPSQLAHPLDDGRVALLEHNADEMASTLGEDSSHAGILTQHRIRDYTSARARRHREAVYMECAATGLPVRRCDERSTRTCRNSSQGDH
jgi:phytoene dehydrogenase-like protein